MRFLVAINTQGWIVFCGTRKEGSQLVFVFLIDSLYGHRILRHRGRHGVNSNFAGLRKGIAGTCFAQFWHHDNIAGLGAFYIGGFLAHHHIEMPQALFFASACVNKFHTRL